MKWNKIKRKKKQLWTLGYYFSFLFCLSRWTFSYAFIRECTKLVTMDEEGSSTKLVTSTTYDPPQQQATAAAATPDVNTIKVSSALLHCTTKRISMAFKKGSDWSASGVEEPHRITGRLRLLSPWQRRRRRRRRGCCIYTQGINKIESASLWTPAFSLSLSLSLSLISLSPSRGGRITIFLVRPNGHGQRELQQKSFPNLVLFFRTFLYVDLLSLVFLPLFAQWFD